MLTTITAFLSSIGAKVWGWIVLIGGILLAVVSLGAYERRKGESKVTQQVQVEQAQEVAQAAQQQAQVVEVSSETQAQVSQLPPAPPQPVATPAASGSAVQQLQDHWADPSGG